MTYSVYDVAENGVLAVGLAGMLLAQVLVLREVAPNVAAEHATAFRISGWAIMSYAALPFLRPVGEWLHNRAAHAIAGLVYGGEA